MVVGMHTLGTHNLHDEAGTVTLFADALLFTEAIPRRIRARVARLAARARGRVVVVCRAQPDLVVVLRRRQVKVTGRTYSGVVHGWAGVTPHRGTFVVLTRWRGRRNRGRRPRAYVIEHRINAAFPPYVRGEEEFRRHAWHQHTAVTVDIIRRLIDSGYDVDAGGDLNTPEDVDGYPGLRGVEEAGQHFDRLASTDQVVDVRVLSRAGSDHPRLLATIK